MSKDRWRGGGDRGMGKGGRGVGAKHILAPQVTMSITMTMLERLKEAISPRRIGRGILEWDYWNDDYCSR